MITIDYQSKTPLYEQIVERFQMLILKGILKPDEQMPSVRSLATSLSINPNTIQKAYAALEQQGYIYSLKGRGNFVSGNDLPFQKEQENFREDLKALLTYGMEIGIRSEECLNIVKQTFKNGGTKNDRD